MARKNNGSPEIKFKEHFPHDDYYIDGDGNYYSVARVIKDSELYPVFDCPIAALYVGNPTWRECSLFELAAHVRRVRDADLKKPIILDWNGELADGRHRIIKALVEGRTTLPAIRLQHKMEPDQYDDKKRKA